LVFDLGNKMNDRMAWLCVCIVIWLILGVYILGN